MGRYSLLAFALVVSLTACSTEGPGLAIAAQGPDAARASYASHGKAASGQTIFRFDTFGDETFWTDTLHMNEVIAKGVSPKTALSVGLKVDATVIPAPVAQGIKAGTVDLSSPATTLALLKLNAVVGVIGKVSEDGKTLQRVGITCALCHSTVDNSFSPGIGKRLDGWPNHDLNVGGIIALSPALTEAQKAVYSSWGPGKYDPRYNIDGKNMPVMIPPAFGLRHVAKEIYTGDGPVSYWNAYVAITQMHGHGVFSDPRVNVNVNVTPDLVTPKLPALREYQFSLNAPGAVAGTFDAGAARRGKVVFDATCSSCHLSGNLSDVNNGVLHAPADVGQSAAYADRSATKKYRTTPLRGLWHAPQLKGPYFHDGSAPTLEAAVEHEAGVAKANLTEAQKKDLVEYLKTL